MVRRSYTGKNLIDQELFAADLLKVGGKKLKLKRFAMGRVKSTHEDPDSDVKQTIANMEYTPFLGVTGTKPLTFKHMVEDPAFESMVEARQARDEIPAPVVEAALELLKHKKVAGKAITMVVEIQYHIDWYLEKRKLVHIFYKVFRTKSALELAMDFAKYANGEGASKAMAYALPAAVANEGYAASMAKKHGLAVGPGVTELDLAGKGLGDGDCAWIIAVIAKCPALRTVHLGNNKFGDTGAAALAGAISKSTSLQAVSLGGNKIGGTGAAALAGAISKSTSLRKVDLSGSLSGNKFSSAGLMALAGAISKSTSLKTVWSAWATTRSATPSPPHSRVPSRSPRRCSRSTCLATSSARPGGRRCAWTAHQGACRWRRCSNSSMSCWRG